MSGWSTRLVRAGLESDEQHGAVVPPLILSSNFTFRGLGERRVYDYTRSGNPTRDQLGLALADAEGGAGAVVTSSGMSAITTVLQLVQPGELVIAPIDGYGGTWRLLDAWSRAGRFELQLVDLSDASVLETLAARKPRLIWAESPTNPLLRLVDLPRLGRIAREADALFVVDNTLLSPALQRPIEFGADLVVHSTTKYLNGHSDVVGGCVVSRTDSLHEQVAWWANCLGVTGAPFDSWLTLRGLRTLPARMRIHVENAQHIVEELESHEAVSKVYYPEIGAMVSFELRKGLEGAATLVDQLRCFSLAESLGGVESLIAHPATMTHAAMSEEARRDAGIGDGLLRLSVGIEDASDLVADLRRGLDAVATVRKTVESAV